MSDILALTREIDRLTREKSEAISNLIVAHREIERHKQEIVRRDVTVAQLRKEAEHHAANWALCEARNDQLEAVYEAAKEWHVARCTRMPSCDPYVGSHDAECLLAIAESHLTNALNAALDAEPKGAP